MRNGSHWSIERNKSFTSTARNHHATYHSDNPAVRRSFPKTDDRHRKDWEPLVMCSLFEKGGMTLIAVASYRAGESLARTLNRFKSLYLFNDAHASCLYTFNLADIPRTRSASGRWGKCREKLEKTRENSGKVRGNTECFAHLPRTGSRIAVCSPVWENCIFFVNIF